MCVKKRVVVIVLTLAMIAALIPAITERSYGTSITDKSVYVINNYVSGDCVLSANVYMLRRAAINKGSMYWNKISLDSLRKYAAVNTNDVKYEYTFSSYGLTYHVVQGSFGNVSDSSKKSKLQSLLKSHKEGIVIWGQNAGPGYPHGILATHYSNGVFYGADSTHNYDNYIYYNGVNVGIESLENTTITKWANLTHYWYLESVSGTASGQVSNSNASTNTPSAVPSKQYTISCSDNGGTGGKELNLDLYETSNIKGSWISRKGYTLVGWNLYREADNKWFVSNTVGWQTADIIKSKGYSKFLYNINQTVQINDSWIEGNSSAKNFIFFAVWSKNPNTPSLSLNLDTSSATKASNYKRIRATWKAVSSAKYQIRYKKGSGAWTKWTSTGSKTYFEKTMSAGSKYSLQVRAYKIYKQASKVCYSTASSIKSIYTLKTSSLSLSKKTSKSVTVKWKNVSGESGYLIYRKSAGSSKWTKIKVVKANTTTFINSKLKKNKTYYYKVRAYKKVGKLYVYSPYSKYKKIKL